MEFHVWISSLVVTLEDNEQRAADAIAAVASMAVFQVGPLQGSRLPVVLETSDGAQARDWHDWILRLPGVVSADVAFVSFDPPDVASSVSS
jgi:nitrate reductase NapAB chaperone NapD